MQSGMDMAEVPRRKRIWAWIPNISEDLVDELSHAGIDVVAISPGSLPGVESFSLHDLFYGSPAISRLGVVPAPPTWLDAEWFRLYSLCVQRIGFVPSSTRMDTRSGNIVDGYDVEDMARVHLSHMAAVLKALSVDEVWFADPPHLAVDNMLSLAAQKMGLKVIEFHQVPSRLKFRAWCNGGSRKIRWDEVRKKPWVQGANPPDTWYMKKPTRQPLWRSLLLGAWRIPSCLIKGSWREVAEPLHYWSERLDTRNLIQRVLERLDPRLSRWERQRTLTYRRFKRNRDGIERVERLDGVGDFVYFPLHYEPEMNVHILGRKFSNQLDAIQALLAVMPKDWTLLVKENPKQGYLHRGSAFFQRLRMLPGVRFVADDMSSRQLIDNSRLVATIVGTAGYEAVLAGKPCVCLGDAWYQGLPGTFRFEDGIDLEALAAFKPEKVHVDQGMNELLGGLPDGLAYPRFAHRFDPQLLPGIYRETARVMVEISAAAD